MSLVVVCYFKTTHGIAAIAFNQKTQRYHALFNDEDLGSYASREHAVDDIKGGYTFRPSSGVDTSSLGIPGDWREWTLVR